MASSLRATPDGPPISCPVYHIFFKATVVGCIIGRIDYSVLIYCYEVPTAKMRNVQT
jgi:hypothetical protein